MGRARVIALPPGARSCKATAAGEEALARLVGGHIARRKLVADLFCRLGPCPEARRAHIRVAAFDSNAAATAAREGRDSGHLGYGSRSIPKPANLFRQPLVATRS